MQRRWTHGFLRNQRALRRKRRHSCDWQVVFGEVPKGERLHLVDALAETVVNQVSVDMGALREEVGFDFSGQLGVAEFERRG